MITVTSSGLDACFVLDISINSEAQMAEFKVDRALLEVNSTEEILKILQEERDDYTPEAIKVFEEILQERRGKKGVGGEQHAAARIRHALFRFFSPRVRC